MKKKLPLNNLDQSIPIAFFGTPEFSVPILKALHESSEFDVKVVISQPDRPSGRNLKLTPSAVKTWALNHSLPVMTPETCKTEEFMQEFKNYGVHACVVVAFGQILNQKLLNTCPDKFINIHASLLPRWRGAAPIQRAVMSGDKMTGVSAQVMVKKLDAGDVIFEVQTQITDQENSLELHDRLSFLAAEKIVSGLKSYLEGNLSRNVQDESLVTYAAKIEKNETWIDWSKSAFEVWNHIRGLAMGPGGATLYKTKRLKIIKAKPIWIDVINLESNLNKFEGLSGQNLNFDIYSFNENLRTKKHGEVVLTDNNGFYICCGPMKDLESSSLKNSIESDLSMPTLLYITSVQPESKPMMKAKDYMNGSGLIVGDLFDGNIYA